ncbi:hypothetical protein VO63_19200 [Streptomyces showdoensis]|uniref:Uncharacterized protein n=1 Tax=Streptomyces showdoensis TaxID=68268 RepID=A0A2P2GLB3_STREW|nr:hypothetical protein VO63_19200 [Streptomyces showdoensis]
MPETEIIVPIVTPSGIAFAVRPGAMPEQTLDRLNEAADHLLSVGLAAIRLPRQTPPPEP